MLSQLILNNNKFLHTYQEQVSGIERFKCQRESNLQREREGCRKLPNYEYKYVSGNCFLLGKTY